MLKDISHFDNTSDYLPIILAVLIVDMVVISTAVTETIHVKSLNAWYHNFGLSAVLADVLIIVIGIIIARFIYPFFFKEYAFLPFLFLVIAVQLVHDLLFGFALSKIPRNVNTKTPTIFNVFKEYAQEVGFHILLVDAAMIGFSTILASYFATWNANSNIVLLIVALYILPYLLYSIPS
jgi:uncharacterized protein YacL